MNEKIVVNSWNEWDPLKHVIVGKADGCCIPAPEPALDAKVPEDSDMKGMHGPRLKDTVDKANDLLNNFASLLEKRGIKVDRPVPINHNQKILQNYFNKDKNMKHETAPKPRLTDLDYRKDYLSEKIGEKKRLEWTEKKYFVTTEEEPLFDAADILRFGKDLVVQHGFTTNLKGIDWLKRHFSNHRVHTVNFPGDPYPIHIDATFTPIREGLIINNPQRRLPKSQRKLFENNDWQIIDSAQPAHNSPPPLCCSSVWLSMNILVLDPKTVCVEKSEIYQSDQLDKLGMEVIPVELRDAYAFGGGLHCCTADVYREGELKDYFPNQ